MKKSTLIMALALILSLALGIGGTLAYLTDTEDDVNVMVVGRVDIDLNEQQRDDEDGLEDFEDGKVLLPLVGSAQGEKDELGLPTATNYVDKIITVSNKDNSSDAWVRVLVAFPAGMDNDQASEMPLHWNDGSKFVGEDNEYDAANWNNLWKPELVQTGVTIAEEEYNIYCFTYQEKLAPGAETKAAAVVGFYLDSRVDWDDETNQYYMRADDGTKNPVTGMTSDGTVYIPVVAQAVQASGFDTVDLAFAEAKMPINPWAEDPSLSNEIPVTKEASDSDELAAAIENNSNVKVVLEPGEYETNFKVDGGKNVTIVGTKDTVLSGQIATTSSTAGTVTLKGVTVKVDDSIVDSTGISQTGKSAIAIWGNQTVICEDVTFDMSLKDATAITSWWDTGVGTTIIVKNCTFNCNGQRPIRATGNVTVENCTFNDPYRYAVQLTAKADTATLLDKAIINFNNNTIVDGANGKTFVYGIQLEGTDYGCNDCVINGAGNKIVDGGAGSTMYYCECGEVVHETIEWNVETTPVHEN